MLTFRTFLGPNNINAYFEYISTVATYNCELLFYYMRSEFEDLVFIEKNGPIISCSIDSLLSTTQDKVVACQAILNLLPDGKYILDSKRKEIIYDITREEMVKNEGFYTIPINRKVNGHKVILAISGGHKIYRIYNHDNLASLLYALYVANSKLTTPKNKDGDVTAFGMNLITMFYRKEYGSAIKIVVSNYLSKYIKPLKKGSEVGDKILSDFKKVFYKNLEEIETLDYTDNKFSLGYILNYGITTTAEAHDIVLDIPILGLDRMTVKDGMVYIHCDRRFEKDIFTTLEDVIGEDSMTFKFKGESDATNT